MESSESTDTERNERRRGSDSHRSRHRVRRSLAPLALIAVAAVACNRVDDEWHSTSQLSEALLTVGDMGGTWRETQRDIFDERAVENPVLDTTFFCPSEAGVSTTLDDLAGQSGADVEMQVKGTSRMMRLQAWENGDAERFFDTLSTAVTRCDGIEWTEPDAGITVKFDAVEGPDVGDDSAHWLNIASPPADNPDAKFGGASRTSVARFGNVVMILQIGDYSLQPESVMMDDVEWRTIVERAAAKIAEL